MYFVYTKYCVIHTINIAVFTYVRTNKGNMYRESNSQICQMFNLFMNFWLYCQKKDKYFYFQNIFYIILTLTITFLVLIIVFNLCRIISVINIENVKQNDFF